MVCFIYPKECSTIWYYHPVEDQWLPGDLQVSIEGVLPALQEELGIVIGLSEQFSQPFDFNLELGKLQPRAQQIFENQSRLPASTIYTIENVPFGGYQRAADKSSEISAGFPEACLVFKCSPHPFKEGEVFVSQTLMNISLQQTISRSPQKDKEVEIIRRANMVLDALDKHIFQSMTK